MTTTVRVLPLKTAPEAGMIVLNLATGELAVEPATPHWGAATTLRLPMPSLDRAATSALLASLAPIAQRVLDGASPTGHLNLPAEEAYDEMGRLVAREGRKS